MLVILLKRLGRGALIAVTGVTIATLFVLMMRWLISRINYVGVYFVEHIHRAYHAIEMEVLHIHHEMQFKVLRAHHGIQVEVLYAHHRWLILNETLLIVFLGLLLIAVLLMLLLFAVLLFAAAIWRHTRATERTAALQHKLHRDIVLAYKQELRQKRVDRLPRSRPAFRAGAGAGSRHTTHGTRTRLMLP